MAGRGEGRRTTINDTRRATKEWDPWLVVDTDREFAGNTRTCVFCGWTSVFVRKRAFSHFGFGGRTASDRCKKIPWAVLQKFRTCRGVVPKEMSFEQMHEE